MTEESIGTREAVFDVPDEVLRAVHSRMELGEELFRCRGAG